jgi:hypothetical protein
MAQAVSSNSIRAAARLANGFALDLVKLGGFGRDVIDGLLLVAISQANIALINRSPDLQRTYATLDDVPPDTLRRPVSINAIANSLHIPFETARRRITALVDSDVLLSTPRGVILPQTPLTSPFYRMGAQANYGLARTLYHRLRAIGLLQDLPRPNGPSFDPAHPPVRLVMRVSADYLLRLVDPLSKHIGDLVTGLVLMQVFHANTEHLDDIAGGDDGPGWTPDSFVPDRDRRPISAVEVARRLGIPAETVRRRLSRLVATDRCERNEAGYFLSGRILSRGLLVDFMIANQGYLHRLFATLAEYGVLSEWERELGDLGGKAQPAP